MSDEDANPFGPDHIEELREVYSPKHLCSSEYSAIFELLEGARDQGRAHAVAILDEFMGWARAAKAALTDRIDHHTAGELQDWLLQSSFDGTICHDTVAKVWAAAHCEGELTEKQGHEEEPEQDED